MNKADLDTLRLFREFVLENATQWKLGASHHHPIWAQVAEALGDDNRVQKTEAEWRYIQAENRSSLTKV